MTIGTVIDAVIDTTVTALGVPEMMTGRPLWSLGLLKLEMDPLDGACGILTQTIHVWDTSAC